MKRSEMNNFRKFVIKFGRSVAKQVLLFIERHIFFPIGIFMGSKLLKQLTPYDANGFEEKIRLGNMSDGGYVIPYKILQLIDVVYSYGVGEYIDFEEDLVRRLDIKVHLYDHTVDKLPAGNKNLFFRRQGIDSRKHGHFNTFKNNLEENGDVDKKILLKMDVEGAEWKVLKKIIDESSKNIIAIVLEIHKLYRYEKIISYIEVLKKLNSKFTIIHLHGCNVSDGLFSFGNKKISRTLEITLVNNNLINEKAIMVGSLPSEKDYPSIRGKEDIPLNFWNNN